MPTAVAGKSLMAFGAVVLVSSVLGAFALDAFIFDLGAVVVVALGMSVAGGNQRAVRWSIAAMVYYLLVAAALLFVGYLRADLLRIAGHAVTPAELHLLLPMVGGFAIWSLVNLVLLKRSLRPAVELS